MLDEWMPLVDHQIHLQVSIEIVSVDHFLNQWVNDVDESRVFHNLLREADTHKSECAAEDPLECPQDVDLFRWGDQNNRPEISECVLLLDSPAQPQESPEVDLGRRVLLLIVDNSPV